MGVAYRLVRRRLEEVGRQRLPLKAQSVAFIVELFVCTHGQAQERSYSHSLGDGEGGRGKG